jgi:hypothetical protein
MRFPGDDPDRGIRTLLMVILALAVVQFVLTIGLFVDRGRRDEPTRHSAAREPARRQEPAPEKAAERVREVAPEPAKPEVSEEPVMQPVRVQVLNGCGAQGVAARLRDFLTRSGYDVRDVGNADRQDYRESRILDRSGNMDAARDLAKLLSIDRARISKLTGTPSPKLDLTLIIGYDYKQMPIAR